MKKTYTRLQMLRKADARTRGVDAILFRNLTALLPTIKRSKTDKVLTRRELGLIVTVRDMLTTRLEVAAYDAMLHDVLPKLKETNE